MNKFVLVAILGLSSVSFAQKKHVFSGSDTLAGAITDAIIASGMDQTIQYAGGGSGLGEKNMISGDQGIAPMSREVTADAVNQLAVKGIKVATHVLALDGLSIFVKSQNPVASLDLQTILRIYTCEFTKWEQVPGSNLRGDIHVFRRNDVSGTTDAFKHFTGIKAFGACVKVVAETADISEATSKDVNAIGYAGLSGKVADNRFVPIARKAGDAAVLPTTATIRNFSYPMSRKLFVYEVTGSRTANETEQEFLSYITDRSFMDPIMQAHEFVTID